MQIISMAMAMTMPFSGGVIATELYTPDQWKSIQEARKKHEERVAKLPPIETDNIAFLKLIKTTLDNLPFKSVRALEESLGKPVFYLQDEYDGFAYGHPEYASRYRAALAEARFDPYYTRKTGYVAVVNAFKTGVVSYLTFETIRKTTLKETEIIASFKGATSQTFLLHDRVPRTTVRANYMNPSKCVVFEGDNTGNFWRVAVYLSEFSCN
jgi:uncharacterized protein YlaN (UPF0358 family)